MHADRMLNDREYATSFEAVLDKKTESTVSSLWLAGLLAGACISLAAYGYLVAQAAGAGKLGGAVMFCGGLIMVVLLQAELFTGNMILGVGAIGRRFSWGSVLRNWGWVYAANFAASLLMAWALHTAGGTELSDGLTPLGKITEKVMHVKTSRTVSAYLVRGFFCNLLVVLAYVMALFARDVKGKMICILFPVTLFVLCGFEHCVANMFLIPFGLLVEGVPLNEWAVPMFGNLIPVTIGNMAGGITVLFLQPRFIRMTRPQQQTEQETDQ